MRRENEKNLAVETSNSSRIRMRQELTSSS